MNIIIKEIKAYCSNPDFIQQYLKDNNAEYIGTDHQVDTYFNVQNGRLKLREGIIETNLIHYERTEVKNIKDSHVSLYKPLNDPKGLKTLLINANGVKAVVDKRRKIFFINNVKFHIDTVKDLGNFVEIEAIGEKGISDEMELARQCNYYMDALGIKPQNLIDKSYSDLILEI